MKPDNPYAVEYHKPYGTLVERKENLSKKRAARCLSKFLADGGVQAFVAVFFNGQEIAPDRVRGHLRQAAQAALDALSLATNAWGQPEFPSSQVYETMRGLRAALAEPQPEPVAWMHEQRSLLAFKPFKDFTIPLYAAPQAQQPLKERPDFIAGYTAGLADGKTCAKRDAQRKPMTDDQVRELVEECGLPWRQGFVPLYPGDTTNRYAVLVREVEGMYNSEAP